jgi:peptide-methionine (S)-S-oxide reductase
MERGIQTIVLGGGCFWCLHAAYKLIKGVTEVVEGYSGGNVPDPTDEQIYFENTGHVEVVKVTFDSRVIGLTDILEIFWTIHNPTTLNRQGPDIGSQYRSAIFYVDADQKPIIEESLRQAQKLWDDPIVTEVRILENFYPASAYHQEYEKNRPDYCQIIINPKLEKLQQKFADRIAGNAKN